MCCFAEAYDSARNGYETDMSLAQSSLEISTLIRSDKVRIVYTVAVCEVGPGAFVLGCCGDAAIFGHRRLRFAGHDSAMRHLAGESRGDRVKAMAMVNVGQTMACDKIRRYGCADSGYRISQCLSEGVRVWKCMSGESSFVKHRVCKEVHSMLHSRIQDCVYSDGHRQECCHNTKMLLGQVALSVANKQLTPCAQILCCHKSTCGGYFF